MTVHASWRTGRATTHTHVWHDGGGSYSSVIEFMDAGWTRVTLFSDSVDTYSAHIIDIPADMHAAIMRELSMSDDYAGGYPADIREYAGMPVPGVTDDDYVIVSHGIALAVSM